MKPVAFDIETTLIDPSEGSYLDPTTARVAEVAFWSEGLAEVYSLRSSAGPADEAERTLLEAVAAQVAELDDALLVGWNSSGFDLPFLVARYAAHGIAELGPDIFDTGEPGKYGGSMYDGTWAGASHYDVWLDWQGFAKEHGIRSGLKPVSEFVGLNPVKIDASHIDTYTPAEIHEYALSDVRCTYELYLRRPLVRAS